MCLFFHVFLVFLFRFVFGCMINLQGSLSLHFPDCINLSNVYFSLFLDVSFFFLFFNHNLQRVPSLHHPEFITPQVICITQLSKLFPILSFQLSSFSNLSQHLPRFFLQHPANPDLLYIIFFCHSQVRG